MNIGFFVLFRFWSSSQRATTIIEKDNFYFLSTTRHVMTPHWRHRRRSRGLEQVCRSLNKTMSSGDSPRFPLFGTVWYPDIKRRYYILTNRSIIFYLLYLPLH